MGRPGIFSRRARRSVGPACTLLASVLAGGWPDAVMAQAQPPRFLSEGPIKSDTGFALIAWTGEGPATLEMAPGGNADQARPVYAGTNSAYFISGLADGDYRLVLRAADGSMSEPLTLHVAHQSLARAFWLAGLGALAFIAILVAIFRGARDD
jgi:hypothetical protein